jgi:hypothetical protein
VNDRVQAGQDVHDPGHNRKQTGRTRA